MPTYAATPSVMTCRRWWRATAAYLPPWSAESPVSWPVVVAAVCGVGVTAVIIGAVLMPSLRLHAMTKTETPVQPDDAPPAA